MSIASKQANLLSSGLLSNLGDAKGDSLQLKGVAKSLVAMAYNLVEQAQKNLVKSNSNSSGDLEESASVENLQIDGGSMGIDVMILDRYKFIDKGVKGVVSGTGKYAFKTKFPSKKMATALLKWLRTNKSKVTSIRKPLGGKHEEKGFRAKKAIDESKNLKSLAYAVATNVKKHGIKPTYFFTNAIKDTEKKWKKEIANGFRLDIIESLKDGNRS